LAGMYASCLHKSTLQHVVAQPSTRAYFQVTSSDTPVDRQTLDQFVGTMLMIKTDQGLLVSWNGFKQSVERERATQFFQVPQ